MRSILTQARYSPFEILIVAIGGGDHQFGFVARTLTEAAFGSTSALRSFDRTVFAEPCSPDIANSG